MIRAHVREPSLALTSYSFRVCVLHLSAIVTASWSSLNQQV